MAALLTSEAGNTDKVVKYINEARGMSISILPPDVNESDLYFTPVGEAIRFGLAAIKNVGENTAKAIRESRLAQGEFKSLYDFCERIESRFEQTRFREPYQVRSARFPRAARAAARFRGRCPRHIAASLADARVGAARAVHGHCCGSRAHPL